MPGMFGGDQLDDDYAPWSKAKVEPAPQKPAPQEPAAQELYQLYRGERAANGLESPHWSCLSAAAQQVWTAMAALVVARQS